MALNSISDHLKDHAGVTRDGSLATAGGGDAVTGKGRIA